MINKVSFTGRETMLTTVSKEVKNTASNYLCAGKVYSAEERLMAERANKATKHQYFCPDTSIKNVDTKPVVKKAEDVDVDFVAETAPHRFNVIG